MDKDMNVLKKRIAEWIKKKVEDAGAKGAVVGLSGGIDSSVVAALANLALGDKVLGVIMPCHSKEEDMNHAHIVSKKFGIKTEVVYLGGIFDSLVEKLPEGNRLALANIKPRLRMTMLYYYANLHNFIVLGTGNKTEELLGYFTKYGDGGVDILPIGDLYKHEVRKLAKELSIPDEIIEKPPSAGLWPGQTDEDEIGMSYDEMDDILYAIEKNDTGGLDKEKVEKIKMIMKVSEHKGRMPEVLDL